MATQRLWPGLTYSGVSLTVYAEDQVTLIPSTGADITLVQDFDEEWAPFVLPKYYRDLVYSGKLVTSDPLALSGDAVSITAVTRVASSLVGGTAPQSHGAQAYDVSDVLTPTASRVDCSAALMSALAGGSEEIFLAPGRYRLTSRVDVLRNVCLRGLSRDSVILDYEGSDFAFLVNSANSIFAPLGPNTQKVQRFIMRDLCLRAPNGSGVFFGTSINPFVLLDNVLVTECAGRALDFGESVYFVTLRKCGFSFTRGVRARAYCDKFTVDECAFGSNKDYDLDLAGPTFNIVNCDFEGNTGNNSNKANIIVRTSDVTSGYAAICHNRFGPEGVAGSCLYDIELSNAGTTAKVLPGLILDGNKHFSPSSGTRKIAPILLDSGISDCVIQDLTVTDDAEDPVTHVGAYYTSRKTVVTSDAANVFQGNPLTGNYVDELRVVDDAVKGVFQERVRPDLVKWRRGVTGEAIAAYSVVWMASYEPAYARGLGRIFKCVSYPWETRFACGVALYAHGSDDRVQFAGQDSVITTTLNTSSSVSNDPVYMGASGTLSLTPHADYVKVVGRVITLGANATIRLDFSEPVRYTAMPAGGRFFKGDYAPKAAPVEAGAGGSKYIVRGWNRVTDANSTVISGGALHGATGSNHTLNTDWFEVRELTGN